MKKTKKLFFIFGLAALSTISCTNINIEDDSNSHYTPQSESIINLNSEIILGEKFNNPFTIEQVQARSATNEQIIPNYFYFRCRSDDNTEMMWLSENNEIMSIIPLDREIIEGGTIYNDPELKEGESRWYYFVKSSEDFAVIKKHNFEIEIIEEMYLDDEDMAILTGDGLDIPDDTYLTVDLTSDKARGIWSTIKKIKKFIQKYIANIPSGKISVYDSILQDYTPVKNVQVFTNQLAVIGATVTDSNGKFTAPIAYTSLGGPVQVFIRFENENITIKDFDVGTLCTNSVVYYEGSHWIEGISKLDIKFKDTSAPGKYSTVMNAHTNYLKLCKKFNLATPPNLNILVTNTISNSCTPLCRYGGAEIIITTATALEPVLGFTATSALLPVMPDIVIGAKNSSNLYRSVFHELSHASHFFGLGPAGKQVWINEYIDMLAGWGEMMINGDSLTADPYNKGGTDLIKLIESWGYFSEGYLMYSKYENIEYLEKLETRTIRNNPSVNYFYYGGFYDLIDDDDYETFDLCSGFTYKDIYTAVISPATCDLNTFAITLTANTSRYSELENIIKTLKANHE